MSAITQRLESTQIKTSHSPQYAAIDPLIPKKIPGFIIDRIAGFTSYDELAHASRLLSKRFPQLPMHALNLKNSQITDKELIELIDKNKGSLTHINLSHCKNITDLSLKHLSKLQNLTTLDLSFCKQITDAGAKDLSKLQNLTTLDLGWCKQITDAGAKDLSNLQNLTALDLRECHKITDASFENLVNMQHLTKLRVYFHCTHFSVNNATELNAVRHLLVEKNTLSEFINEKSRKFGIPKCELLATSGINMYCKELPTGCQIAINFLYLLTERNMDSFFSQNPDDQESVSTFLIEKRPELLDKATTDLIKWFNSYKLYNLYPTSDNPVAKSILIMHATGKLSAMKRFLLTHEMDHAKFYESGRTFGEILPFLKFDFIQLHQYLELRADLTAAREENAHDLGIAYFQWMNILSPQPDKSDPHPTDENRAKVLKIDRADILLMKIEQKGLKSTARRSR